MAGRDTTRQREAGAAARAETRRRLLVAARELFAEQGYAPTTVTAIARGAGVSLQTLYLAWASKHALLRAVLEEALSGAVGGLDDDYVPRLRAGMGPTGDAATTLRAFAGLFRGIADRAAPWWRVYRDAAAAEPVIAQDWADLTVRRRDTTAALLADLDDAALRPGLDRAAAVDTAWTLASPETHDLLVGRGGYSADAFEAWLAATLVATLLPDGVAARGTRLEPRDRG